MHRNDTIARSDRVMLAALAIILVTVSATLGAAMSYHAAPSLAANPLASAPQEDQDTALTQLAAEHRCLTEALYYEARGEGRNGEQAVAEVVFHRMTAGYHGHSICAVVYEGSFRRGCQFSFTCDGALHRPHEASAWKKSEQLAAPPGPIRATRIIRVRAQRARDDAAIAEPVKNGFATVDLDAAQDVGMVANDDIGARVDGGMRDGPLVGRERCRRVHDALVQGDDDDVGGAPRDADRFRHGRERRRVGGQ